MMYLPQVRKSGGVKARTKRLLKSVLLPLALKPPFYQALKFSVGWPLFPEWVRVRLPSPAKVIEVELPNGTVLKYDAIFDDPIGKALFWGKWDSYEPETTPLYFRLATDACTVVDVGANSGYFTVLALAANPRLTAISFEPVPTARERLLTNLKANGFSSRTIVEDVAVGNRAGSDRMVVGDGALPTMSSLSKSRMPNGERFITVDVVRLDDKLQDVNSIDLVKIDVEGLEEDVILGMRGIIKHHRPIVIAECLTDSSGRFPDVITPFQDLGYRFFRLYSTGMTEVTSLSPDHKRIERNVLICPEEKSDLLFSSSTSP